MTDTLTLTGLVATPPRHVTTGNGLAVTTFRLASNQRRYDRNEQKWVDADTNWYTIATFRQLAINIASSLEKGQRVVVTGRLRVRDWTTDDKKGTSVEVIADAVGHDLSWGTSSFTRSAASIVADAEAAAADAAIAEAVEGADSYETADKPAAAAVTLEQEAVAVGTPF